MKQKCLLITDILTVIFAIILILISFFVRLKISNLDYSDIESLGINWNHGTIESFVEPTKTNICPDSSELLINDFWPGIVEGCYCKSKNETKKGKCTSYMLLDGCIAIEPIKPIRYKGWRSKAICVKRGNTNYLDLNVFGSKEKCPKKTKNCGFIDSLGNKLCLEKCPINDIEIADKNKTNPAGYKSYDNLTGKKLIYTTEESHGLIVLIRIICIFLVLL